MASISQHRMAKRWGWLVIKENLDYRKEKTRAITAAGNHEVDKLRRKWGISETAGRKKEDGWTVQGCEQPPFL